MPLAHRRNIIKLRFVGGGAVQEDRVHGSRRHLRVDSVTVFPSCWGSSRHRCSLCTDATFSSEEPQSLYALLPCNLLVVTPSAVSSSEMMNCFTGLLQLHVICKMRECSASFACTNKWPAIHYVAHLRLENARFRYFISVTYTMT